jgi:tetratricopeptide (TPR) repeat protein
LLYRNGRYDEALVLYDALITRLVDASKPEMLERLAAALLDKGKVLFTEERFEEAIEVFDTIIERFGQADSAFRKRAVTAVNNKTAALNHLGRIDEAVATHQRLLDEFSDEALAAFDDLVRESIDAVEQDGREQLAGALVAKAGFLAELNRREDSIATFTQLIDRFEDDDAPLIRHVVAMGREARDHLLADDTDEESDPA